KLRATYAAEDLATISSAKSLTDLYPQSQQQQQQQPQYKLEIDNNVIVTNDSTDTGNTVQPSTLLTSSGINNDRRVFFQDELPESTTTRSLLPTEVCYYQSLLLDKAKKKNSDIGDILLSD
uniref:GA15393 n=1 Tax=Loa loa TaxID=7209 RepID=A0A1I7VIY0_LOALO